TGHWLALELPIPPTDSFRWLSRSFEDSAVTTLPPGGIILVLGGKVAVNTLVVNKETEAFRTR
ncbi:hypothetical protein P692DRAFT_20736502, partial [Suillus brevipes Sb2]